MFKKILIISLLFAQLPYASLAENKKSPIYTDLIANRVKMGVSEGIDGFAKKGGNVQAFTIDNARIKVGNEFKIIRVTNTPLHIAARRGDIRVLMTLLKNGANPNIADSRGQTPLHYAIRYGKFVSIRAFRIWAHEIARLIDFVLSYNYKNWSANIDSRLNTLRDYNDLRNTYILNHLEMLASMMPNPDLQDINRKTPEDYVKDLGDKKLRERAERELQEIEFLFNYIRERIGIKRIATRKTNVHNQSSSINQQDLVGALGQLLLQQVN